MLEHAEAFESICASRPIFILHAVTAAPPARQSPQEESRTRREETSGNCVSLSRSFSFFVLFSLFSRFASSYPVSPPFKIRKLSGPRFDLTLSAPTKQLQ
jgi:hypothetical protein